MKYFCISGFLYCIASKYLPFYVSIKGVLVSGNNTAVNIKMTGLARLQSIFKESLIYCIGLIRMEHNRLFSLKIAQKDTSVNKRVWNLLEMYQKQWRNSEGAGMFQEKQKII